MSAHAELATSHATPARPDCRHPRWVVVHKGARDAYQVALALAQAGALDTLLTDWYSPMDRRWFATLASVAPVSVRSLLRRRYRDGLPSKKVRAFPRDLLVERFEPARERRGDSAMGRRAGELARSAGAGILAYSCYGHAAFSASGGGAGPRVLFQVHPHPASLRRLYEAEIAREPGCADSLRGEPEMSVAPRVYQERCEEARLADLCVVASSYTRRTLVENGVDPSRIHVVPYGVETPPLAAPERPERDRFRVLFVGQPIQRKGLRYLLEAWRRLALPHAELVIAGRGATDYALLARHAGEYRLAGAVSAGLLRLLYQRSDVLCVPSLAEGFGQVYLEALAHGTPVIATANTGAADLVSDGAEGFVVPPGEVTPLMDRLAWCHAHRSELAAMRVRARALAERHPWLRFRQTVADLLVGVAP